MQEAFSPAVYILASKRNDMLYAGVTSKLPARVHQHRHSTVRGGLPANMACSSSWFEQHATMEAAIAREKRTKKWNRAWKLS